MKTLKLLLLIAIFGVIGSNKMNAQIGIAVAKDKNGSSIEWQVVWNKGYKTESTARQNLKNKGYTKISTLTGGKSRGHHLKSGYWVVVEAKHRIYNGTMKTSFGLGASSSSYREAERRAVSNLSQYDWTWKKSHGYSVSRRGTF